MNKQYEQILKDLKNKIYHPVYFLHGEEPYFIDKISDYIQYHVLEQHEREFNQTVVYGKDTDAKTLLDILIRYPLMANYQVVILKEAQQMRHLDQLENYIKKPAKTTVFVINYKHKKIDKRTSLWKNALSKTCVLESERLYDSQLPAFVRQIVAQHHHTIDDRAVDTLVEHLGNDLSKIENEIAKLILNVAPTETITTSHIEKYIGISRDYNIFELQKALSRKDKNKVYRIIDYYIKNNKEYPPVLVLGMLYAFFSKAFHYQSCKDQPEARKEMMLNYFQEQDLKEYCKNYSIYQTQRIFDLLLTYDMKIKGVGHIHADKELLLRELAYRILNA